MLGLRPEHVRRSARRAVPRTEGAHVLKGENTHTTPGHRGRERSASVSGSRRGAAGGPSDAEEDFSPQSLDRRLERDPGRGQEALGFEKPQEAPVVPVGLRLD